MPLILFLHDYSWFQNPLGFSHPVTSTPVYVLTLTPASSGLKIPTTNFSLTKKAPK